MEVTKWLKPSISVSRIGDSASVQAATTKQAFPVRFGHARRTGDTLGHKERSEGAPKLAS